MKVEMVREDGGIQAITISATAGNATEVQVSGVTSGTLHITTASVTAVNVAVYAATKASGNGGTYRALFDQYGVAVVIPLVDDTCAYDIPGAAFGSNFIKFVAASGSDFNADVSKKA